MSEKLETSKNSLFVRVCLKEALLEPKLFLIYLILENFSSFCVYLHLGLSFDVSLDAQIRALLERS